MNVRKRSSWRNGVVVIRQTGCRMMKSEPVTAMGNEFPVGEHPPLLMPVNPAIVAVIDAIWKGGARGPLLSDGWRYDGPLPRYTHRGRRGARIVVYPTLDRFETIPWPRGPRDQRCPLNSFTCDVALVVLTRMAMTSREQPDYRPFVDPLPIGMEQFFSANASRTRISSARSPTPNIWRARWERRISVEFARLTALRLDVEGYTFWDKSGDGAKQRRISWQCDALFDVLGVDECPRSGQKLWKVRAGRWAERWFNPTAQMYLTEIPRWLIHSEPYFPVAVPALLPKKLVCRLLLYRHAVRSARSIELPVERILSMIGELLHPHERSTHWAGRIRDRLEDALLTLQEAGVVEAVQWPVGRGPGDPDRGRGWVSAWFDTPVRIVFAKGPTSARLEAKRTARTGAVPTDIESPNYRTGDYAQLRYMRTARGITQMELARALRISDSYLSQIENGQRLPGETVRKRILAWLDQ